MTDDFSLSLKLARLLGGAGLAPQITRVSDTTSESLFATLQRDSLGLAL